MSADVKELKASPAAAIGSQHRSDDGLRGSRPSDKLAPVGSWLLNERRMMNPKKYVVRVAVAAAAAIGLAVGPAVAASAATTTTIEGSVPKSGGNAFFAVGRAHSSGPIKVSMSSYNGCGSQLVMALRNGKSATAARVTNVIQFKNVNTTYTFTRKGSTSTTIPSGTYYITAALAEPGAGCPGENQLPFKGKLTI